MGAKERRICRSVLTGAVKWLPHCLILFSVFVVEASVQLQITENDYVWSKLRGKIREKERNVNLLEQEVDRLQALRRMDNKAPEIGLVHAKPGQIEILNVKPDPPEHFQDVETSLASLTASRSRTTDERQRE